MNNRNPFSLHRNFAPSIITAGARPPREVFEIDSLEDSKEALRAGQKATQDLGVKFAEGMSLSLPKNVPSFTSSQRPYEDGYWGHSGQAHRQNGHAVNGMGDKINGFFDKRELPMYKDKPYSYAASRRQRSFSRWKRVVFGATSLFVCLLYWFTSSSSPTKIPKSVKSNGAGAWGWFNKPSGTTVDWQERRERVKDAFVLSWDGYEQYAWGRSSQLKEISIKHALVTLSTRPVEI